VIVFQPNAGICVVIILENVIPCLEVLWKTNVTDVVHERLGPSPLGAEAMPLSLIAPTRMQVTLTVLKACTLIPLVDSTVRQGLKALAWMARPKSGQNLGCQRCGPYHGELYGSPLSAGIGAAWAQDRGLGLPLKQALCLISSGDAEDALQLAVHLVHPVR
jgi:hypothetical protein